MGHQIDEIGRWSEIKLEIIEKYASAYSKIMAAQKKPPLYHIYIDGFAGSGQHLSKTTGDVVQGSPLRALSIEPPFKAYHFIDIKLGKVDSLRNQIGDRDDVRIYNEDCNKVLLEKIFPQARYRDYKRALCLLDPYGLDLDWKVILEAGTMGSIELFLNFPIEDMNRNVLRRNPENVTQTQLDRMNLYWGDNSWRKVAYDKTSDLFGREEKKTNAEIAKVFQKRLIEIAHFKFVPDPLPMCNSKGTIIYYLFFASQKPVARNIVKDIFNKYR